jgi:polyisoprenoid-binding protein YceI
MNSQDVSRTATPAARAEARERWEIGADSTLEFTLRHIVIAEIRGRFHRWGGTLLLDREQPSRSIVDVWIDLSSIDTDSAERDEHVRSPEFLDVARYPRAHFKSTAVELDDERVRVRGKLDLHGVVQELELEVEARETSRDENGAVHVRYVARGALNRQVFGLHWNQDLDVGGLVVGDRIDLSANVDAVRLPDDVRNGRA